MKTAAALEGGLIGAFALSVIHELLKYYNPDAPHMDELGMEALAKTIDFAKLPVPEEKKLFLMTLAGDIIANAAFYSAVGIGSEKQVWLRGILLGLSAGIGGVFLPKPMGLNEEHSNRTLTTKLMTLGLYLAGGLIASAAISHLQKRKE